MSLIYTQIQTAFFNIIRIIPLNIHIIINPRCNICGTIHDSVTETLPVAFLEQDLRVLEHPRAPLDVLDDLRVALRDFEVAPGLHRLFVLVSHELQVLRSPERALAALVDLVGFRSQVRHVVPQFFARVT